MRFMHVCLVAAVVLALAVVPAAGAVFTDRATWEAALSSRQDISFNALPLGSTFNVTQGSGSDTVFIAPQNAMWLDVVGNSYGNSCDVRCLFVDTLSINAGFLATLALTTNTAVGFNVFTVNSTAQTVTIRIYNVGSVTPDYTTTVATVANTSTTPVFFGYTGTAGIKQVEILTAPNTGDVVLDNFSYGVANNDPPPPPPAETPEIPTLSYFGIGLLAVLFGSNKRIRV
jgi:hypothetical protein